jgi:CheY-like chemotaxis protein
MAISNNKLIVVDDEPITRDSFSSIFSQLGYDVRSAEDGFAALALMREFLPDILLSDLNMPGMSGFELLSVVRRLYPMVHVIATSGAFSGKNVPEGIAADDFYEKATALSVLFNLIKAAAQPGRVAARTRAGTVTPIWMTPAGKLPSDEVYVLISCPECLRAFPKLLSRKASLICETGCHYCQTPISYAIVRSDGILSGTGSAHDDPGTKTLVF